MKPESTLENVKSGAWLRIFKEGIWDIALGLFSLCRRPRHYSLGEVDG